MSVEQIDGMIGKGSQSTRRKPAPVPLCPPQIPQITELLYYIKPEVRERTNDILSFV
jgi:hypothetical protein